MLASEYGWNIEYIMNLTRPQINALVDGMDEINKKKDSKTTSSGDDAIKDIKINKDGKANIDTLLSLFTLPGTKITNKAQEMLKNIKEKESDKNV